MWRRLVSRIRRRLGVRPPRRVKTPTILQVEAIECGAAALAIVLAHFGRWVTIEELRLACGVSRNGSKAANILLAARDYDLGPQAFKSELSTLRTFRPPMILHWNFNHFVVLEGFGRDGRVHLNDPAVGRVTVSERELDESFTGVVLTFDPTEGFEPEGKPPSFLPALRRRLTGAWAAVAFVLLAGVAVTASRMVTPVFPKVFVDRVLLGPDPSWLTPLLLVMSAGAALIGALMWLQQRYLLRLETRLALKGSSQLLWHILHLPVEFFSQRYAGDISSRLTIPNRVAELLSRDLATNFLSAILVVFVVVLMLSYDLTLTAIGVLIALLNVLALRYFSRRRADSNRRLQQEKGKMQGAVMGGLELIETVKATGSESDLFSRWAGYQTKVVNLRQKLERDTQLLEAIPPLLAILSTTCILGLGSLRVIDGTLTLGELVAFQALTVVFLAPVSRLVSLGGKLQTVQADLHRLDDVLRHPTQGASETGPRVSAAPKLAGAVELRNVSFGYDRSAPPLIRDLTLILPPGARVAVVGVSGSGKTTLAKLVSGLLDPWDGEILFDGEPRSRLSRETLNQSLASVDQVITLFEGTVRENLTLWDPTVPLEWVVAAARDAVIHDEIMARPGGYESRVEEDGRNWSGGQRQRLEIARALAGEPSILILDEATAALDPTVELQIDRNLRRRGCTSLIIAHRLSTLRDADEILVLDDGEVAERGTHDELLQGDGLYAGLVSIY